MTNNMIVPAVLSIAIPLTHFAQNPNWGKIESGERIEECRPHFDIGALMAQWNPDTRPIVGDLVQMGRVVLPEDKRGDAEALKCAAFSVGVKLGGSNIGIGIHEGLTLAFGGSASDLPSEHASLRDSHYVLQGDIVRNCTPHFDIAPYLSTVTDRGVTLTPVFLSSLESLDGGGVPVASAKGGDAEAIACAKIAEGFVIGSMEYILEYFRPGYGIMINILVGYAHSQIAPILGL